MIQLACALPVKEKLASIDDDGSPLDLHLTRRWREWIKILTECLGSRLARCASIDPTGLRGWHVGRKPYHRFCRVAINAIKGVRIHHACQDDAAE